MTQSTFQKGQALRPHVREPTPLLRFLADHHADRLSALWPAPHSDFFILPTARRHAAAILSSSLGQRHALSADGLIRLIERQKDRVLADLIVGPENAAGFMKALAKLGETLWQEVEYKVFLHLFCQDETNVHLRHLDEIRPHSLKTISFLPAGLRSTRVLNFVRGQAVAEQVRLAYSLVGRLQGAAAQAHAVDRWSRAATREGFFSAVADELTVEHPVRWSPPPALPGVFEPIESQSALRTAALEFRNCLRDFSDCFGAGRIVFYIWRGTPNAAVALTWNIDGWRLAEAEAADNVTLAEGPLREIVKALEANGVRTGPSIIAVRNRLRRYGTEPVTTIADEEPEGFIDACDLGDLWA